MVRPVFASLAALALSLVAGGHLVAAPPRPGELAGYKQDGSYAERMELYKSLGNDRYAPELVERANWKIERAKLQAQGAPQATLDGLVSPPPGDIGMPSTGTVNIACLLIEFSDLRPAAVNTSSFIDDGLFGSGVAANAPYESLTAYYARSSFNKLNIQGNTYGWYRTAYPRSQVETTTTGREALIKEALASYDAANDFSQYDNDNDGEIDCLIVMYAGPDTGWGSFWWGYQPVWTDPAYTIDGKRIGEYVFQFVDGGQTTPFEARTAIHETGHVLGLPDLYDTNEELGPAGGVGDLDIMHGKGDHNGFHKWLLGWSEPQVVGSEGIVDKAFRPAGTSGDGALVMKGAVEGDAFREFFFVENRTRAGNDDVSDWPGSGLMIWHVDATLSPSGNFFAYNNSVTDHKLLRVMEADGLEEIEQDLGGNSGDFWKDGQVFGHDSTPSSDCYHGGLSGVDVFGIETVDDAIWAYLSVSNEPPSVAVAAKTIECAGTLTWVTHEAQVYDPEGDLLTVTWTVDGVVVSETKKVPSGSSAKLERFFPHGTTEVVVSVADPLESGASQGTTVTVQDTTDPIVIVTQNLRVTTDPGKSYASNVRLPLPQVNDACDGDPTLTNDFPDRIPIGEQFVTWHVEDHSGNWTDASQTILVVDEEPPHLFGNVSTTKGVNRGKLYSTYRLPKPEAIDNSGKAVTIKGNAPKRYPIGTTTVTWTGTDVFGNEGRFTSTVKVTNGRPKANAGKNLSLSTSSEKGASVRLSAAKSSDPDDHVLTYLWQAKGAKFSSPRNVSPEVKFPVGRTKVTLTVTDEAGDSSTDSMYVTVKLKRSAGRRSQGTVANEAFHEASSTAHRSVADRSAEQASLNGYGYLRAAEGYGVAAGEFVRWEEGQSESAAAAYYFELRSFQAAYGEQATSSLIRAFAETGDEKALEAALQAARGVQAAHADLASP